MKVQIVFLGTAGARYVVAKQLRASAGTLLRIKEDSLLLDPGPGTLVHLVKRKIPLEKIKVILLSHQHLDHSADLNIMVDAITEGGFKKRGILFLPEQALKECILLPYLTPFLEKIETLKPRTYYEVPPFKFTTTCLLNHGVETYGFIFEVEERKIGFLTDTAYFEGLIEEYKEVDELLIVNSVRLNPKEGVLHLSIEDLRRILTHIRPKRVVLTHFGMTMLKANPVRVARELSDEFKIEIRAAYDGMEISV